MDIGDTIAPNSDQLDAVDLIGGERTFTITEVVIKSSAEQPVEIRLAEFPRVWRPGKSMRRVLMGAWGKRSSEYVGRRITLYCDPDVRFGGAAVGGTRIRAMSHIDKPMGVPLLVSRGKSAMFTVQPLPDDVAQSIPEPTAEQVAASTDRNELGDMWRRSGPERRAQIEARVLELDAPPAED
jgi:hypothetical protein